MAPAAVVGLVALLTVAIKVSEAPAGSAPRLPLSTVITASTSVSTISPAQLAKPPQPGPELQPVTATGGSGCQGRVLRVMQFNIHFGVSRGGSVDPARIASEIAAVRPDLVSLNEVDSGTRRSAGIDEAGYLAAATGLHAVYGPNLPWDGGLFGNAILTRFPVVESHNLRLPGVTGLEPRGLLTATVRVGRRALSFSSMHLSDGNEGEVSRVLQAQAVAGVVRNLSGPTIVAGDLNAPPDALPVRIVRQYLLDAQEYGGTGPGDTLPEPDPQSRIDYVLYDRHLAVVPGSTRVLPSASSDHRSVVTDLVLLPGRCAG